MATPKDHAPPKGGAFLSVDSAYNRDPEKTLSEQISMPSLKGSDISMKDNESLKDFPGFVEESDDSLDEKYIVDWSKDDPENPKNWSLRKKWGATVIVSLFSLMSPMASAMISPALDNVSKDLHITEKAEAQMAMSVFVMAYAVGPLVLGPISEVVGRMYVIQLSNLFFLAWNLGCAFAQNKTQLIVFRFLSGLGGSAQIALGGGILSDCWHPEQRGKAVGIYALMPMLGPAIAPIAGGFIAQYSTWRWVFWSTSIADVVIQVLGVFFLKETYAPVLLKRKTQRLIKETGNTKLRPAGYEKDIPLGTRLRTALVRPAIMITTQPIIQVIALYMAYLFGLIYLLLSTFPGVYQGAYGESVSISSLNFISLGLGLWLGAQVSSWANDIIYKRLKTSNNDTGRPEFRVPLMFIGSILIPVGLFWYGWSAEARLHWIMPNIGVIIFAIGAIMCNQCMQTYTIDSYQRFAASGMASTVFLRSIAGFVFPMFAPYMYDSLGNGWGNSVLGFVGIGLGIPAPFVFWFFGRRLREMSQYAAG